VVGVGLGLVQMAAGILFWPAPGRATGFRGERLLSALLTLWGVHRMATQFVNAEPGSAAYLTVHAVFITLYFLSTFAVIIMVLPPSPEVLEARMRERGDSEDLIRTRREMAAAEEAEGREIADHVVVNDDLARALEELAGIVSAHHSQES